MADRRGTRRSRARTWAAALAAPVLVVSGLTLALSGTGSGDTSTRRPVVSVEEPSVSPTPASAPNAPVDGGAASRPRRTPVAAAPDVVVVPALGVRAQVDPISVVDGALTPPDDPSRIGWWSAGARPGSTVGKAVLTGHTVNAGGGAFDDLETVAAGETVVVESVRGRLVYDVTSVRVLSRAELARENRSIFSQDGPHRLVLITCEDWDGVAYRSNVVIEAAPRA